MEARASYWAQPRFLKLKMEGQGEGIVNTYPFSSNGAIPFVSAYLEQERTSGSGGVEHERAKKGSMLIERDIKIEKIGTRASTRKKRESVI